MPEVPALPDATSLAERVARIFDAESGSLAATFDGFEGRTGQQRLASEVARTFEQGGILVAEAGTGTGKTLAYLIPSVLSGRRVLVSTGTRTLQDQIFYKDVPSTARALGREVRATYMKGRTNYLCRHRFNGMETVRASLTVSDRHWLERISEWVAETETGDRAEIDDLPDDLPFWSELTATGDQCLGRDCPEYATCFVTAMRARAAEAELVIVNHHLLCADASVRQGEFGEVIPECDLLVIDEAHQLEDVVTQYFGVSMSSHRLDELIRDITQLAAVQGVVNGSAAIVLAVGETQSAGRRLFDEVRYEMRARSATGDRVRLTPAMAERLEEPRAELATALDGLRVALHAVRDASAAVDGLMRRVEGAAADLTTLLAAEDPRYVHFVETRGRSVALRAAPIDASGIIRDVVIGERHATVLTSATLTVAGGFEYTLARLGTAEARTLRLPSEFDFATQSTLFLPADMPDPKSPAFNIRAAEIVADLLECSSGRAFVLFTSYSALHDVRRQLADRVRWPLLVQGTASRTALLRDFRATPHAVLLATSSFWQGVDVAGDALSCVVIDRLPFASPGDPLVAARIGAIEARGGQPFQEYQVPVATITLLQGLGRLIRSRTDRGVLAVLDPRLTRMSYGRRFLASLPPSPVTTSMEDVRRFFTERDAVR